MSIRLVTPAQMREMDRRTIEEIGLPGLVLMERAALGVVEAALEFCGDEPPLRVGILCGRGNNGGDGLAVARLLHDRGVEVVIGLMSPEGSYQGDAATNLAICRAYELDLRLLTDGADVGDNLEALGECDLWIDALLGTGLDRDVEGAYADAIDFLNAQRIVVAVDIPSGVDGESGQIRGLAVDADLTVTFGEAKLGQALFPGRAHCGALHVVDIGLPEQVCDAVCEEAGAVAQLLTGDEITLTPREPTFHKGDAGRLFLVGGALGHTGAILMATRAALLSGAGLLTVGTEAAVVPTIAPALPEAMAAHALASAPIEAVLDTARHHAGESDVVAVGPGLGTGAGARATLEAILDAGAQLVLDADALNLIAAHPELRGRLAGAVLTPHPGEMARLRDLSVADILADPVGHARALAEESGSIVVLKVASTVVASPDGRLAINSTGNAGMATGGMGDALTGVIAARLGNADAGDPFQATCAAVWAHGRAADLAAGSTGLRGLCVSALLDCLPSVWRALEGDEVERSPWFHR